MSLQTETKVRTRVVKKSITPFFDKKTLYITLLIILNIVVLSGLDYYFINNFSFPKKGQSKHSASLNSSGTNSSLGAGGKLAGSGPGMLFKAWINTGNNLYSKGLYTESAQILEQAVVTGNSADPLMAGAAFKLGKINLDYLKKPSQAAKWFFLVQNIAIDEKLKKEAQKLLINSLERAGRSQAARNILNSAVTSKSGNENSVNKTGSPDTAKSLISGDIVAQVGDKKYSFIEFKAWADKALANRNPGDKGPGFDTPQGREQLLQNFLGRELLYQSGIRKGYENDSLTLSRIDEIKKDIIANRVYQEEIIKKINPDEEKLRLFYNAHKTLFKGSPYNECRQQVFQAYIQSAQANASAETVSSLLGGEDVKIHRSALFKSLGTNGIHNAENSIESSINTPLTRDIKDPTKKTNKDNVQGSTQAEKQIEEQIKAQLKKQLENQKGKTLFNLPGSEPVKEDKNEK